MKNFQKYLTEKKKKTKSQVKSTSYPPVKKHSVNTRSERREWKMTEAVVQFEIPAHFPLPSNFYFSFFFFFALYLPCHPPHFGFVSNRVCFGKSNPPLSHLRSHHFPFLNFFIFIFYVTHGSIKKYFFISSIFIQKILINLSFNWTVLLKI